MAKNRRGEGGGLESLLYIDTPKNDDVIYEQPLTRFFILWQLYFIDIILNWTLSASLFVALSTSSEGLFLTQKSKQ